MGNSDYSLWNKDEFVNFPVPLDVADYQRAVEYVVDSWSCQDPAPVSVIQIGEVKAPGISDIDLILVFEDDAILDWSKLEPSVFPGWVRQMLTHGPFCCTMSAWKMISGWFPAFDYKQVAGIELPVPQWDNCPGNWLGFFVDYAVVKNPVDFLRFACDEQVSVRDLLLVLNSAKYTVKLAEMAGIPVAPSAMSAVDSMTQLRAGWFTRSQPENTELLKEAYDLILHLCADLIASCDELLRPCLVTTLGHPVTINDGWWSFQFDQDWSLGNAAQLSLRAFQSDDTNAQPIWSLPLSFLAVLSVYADEKSSFRKHFALPRVDFDFSGTEFEAGLRFHAQAMESYAVSSTRLRVPVQRYIAYALYYDPSIFRRILRRIRG